MFVLVLSAGGAGSAQLGLDEYQALSRSSYLHFKFWGVPKHGLRGPSVLVKLSSLGRLEMLCWGASGATLAVLGAWWYPWNLLLPYLAGPVRWAQGMVRTEVQRKGRGPEE